MQVFLSFINNDVVLAYSGDVIFQGETSTWQAAARALYQTATFEQKCSTVTTEAGSRKLWRGNYAISETESPAKQLADWLAWAGEGQGRILPEPISASEISSVFPEDSGKVHLLIMEDVAVDWRSLCDANIDTLFGGEDLLETAGSCTVTLMFRQDTLELMGIYLSAMEGEAALEGALLISKTESGPEIDGLLFLEEPIEAPLAEEWDLLG